MRFNSSDKRTRNGAVSLKPEHGHPESLRIGLFSESFSPVRNGVTTSLNTLIGGLRGHGHRVWVCAPAHDGQAPHETNVLRFPSFVTAYNREYPLAYPFYPRLALSTHFNRLRLDIVHTHTPFVLGLTGAKLAITRGTPLISTFHTFYSQYTHYLPVVPEMMSQSLLEIYLPWYYNRCSTVICPSNTAKSVLLSMGVETEIAVVPTGVAIHELECPEDHARTSTRELHGWGQDVSILLYAGRLSDEKNIPWLFTVLSRVRDIVANAILVIVGDGPARAELELLADEAGIKDHVVFVGNVHKDKMRSYYVASDVFCFPSGSETQGLVVSEARAAGLPVVVVDSGGAPETVQNGIDGFIVPEHDIMQFAEQTIRIITTPELRANMSRAAKLNAKEFTPERMMERILNVYEAARSAPVRTKSLVPPFEGKGPYWNIFSQH